MTFCAPRTPLVPWRLAASAAALGLALLPAAAQAAGDGSGTFDTVRWTLDADGGLTVSGTGDLPDSAFAGRTDIVAVTFTGQVARIGRSAFAGCTQLRRVDGFGAVTSDERAIPSRDPRPDRHRLRPV